MSGNFSDMDDLQKRVAEWGETTFPESTEERTLAHLKDEVENELHAGCDVEEYADVCLLLMHALHRFRGVSLREICERKFAINQEREWGPINDRGFREHVKPSHEESQS